MHDGGGGSVVYDLGAVVEVVQVVAAIEAPKTKHVVQNQVLEREEADDECRDRRTHGPTDGRTDSPRPASSSWTRCFSGASRAAAPLGSLAAWRIDQCVNQLIRSRSQRKRNIHLHVKGPRSETHRWSTDTETDVRYTSRGLNS